MFNFRDQTPHFLSESQIKQMLYSQASVLDQAQREMLREEISRARTDGKMSSYKLHLILKSLREQNKISRYDQEAVEEAFGEIFEKSTN